MSKSSRHQEGRNQERSNSRACDIGVRVRDVVEHTEPQKRISETQDGASHDGRPVGGLSIARKCEPEERDREEPDCDEGHEKSCLGTVGTVLLPIAGVQPGLHWNEAEHY